MKQTCLYGILAACCFLFATSCEIKKNSADAYGNFEATDEIIVSAEGTGKLLTFEVSEGAFLKAGTVIGMIDTAQLYLQKLQLEANIAALRAQTPNIPVQLKVLEDQLSAAEREKRRIENLVKNAAATSKQLDDITSQNEILKSQILATKSTLSTQIQGTLAQIEPLRAQMNLVDDMIAKCRIENPISGTVLTKFVNQFEFTATGRPLYKIADIGKMTLRVYVAEDQLSAVKIGASCTVHIDITNGKMKDYQGIITWISDKSEFTPKMIQTKNERGNLVYAVKIEVENDGGIKIGMPGEAKF